MALTKISTGGVKDDAASQAKIADEAIDEARLQVSNAGSNGQFLQKQSGNSGGLTWATVDTNLSSDTSPQLGGNLDVNAKNIILGDSSDGTGDDVIKFGADTDLSIYSNGTEGIFTIPDAGTLKIKQGTSDLATFSGSSNQIDFHEDVILIGAGSNAFWDKSADTFNSPILNATSRVHISGSAGTSGHVLTSGGSGGAPSWAAVPAGGNSVDLVADGAIAAGKPVIIKTNGKAEQVKETLTALSPPTRDPAQNSLGTSFNYSNIGRINSSQTGVAWSETTKIGSIVFADDHDSDKLTTRGFRQNEMVVIAKLINDIITDVENEQNIENVRKKVCELCDSFPLYEEFTLNEMPQLQ